MVGHTGTPISGPLLRPFVPTAGERAHTERSARYPPVRIREVPGLPPFRSAAVWARQHRHLPNPGTTGGETGPADEDATDASAVVSRRSWWQRHAPAQARSNGLSGRRCLTLRFGAGIHDWHAIHACARASGICGSGGRRGIQCWTCQRMVSHVGLEGLAVEALARGEFLDALASELAQLAYRST